MALFSQILEQSAKLLNWAFNQYKSTTILSLTKYQDVKLYIFHYCFAAGTGRLTKAPSNKSGVSSCGLNRPINKYSNSTAGMNECDWLARWAQVTSPELEFRSLELVSFTLPSRVSNCFNYIIVLHFWISQISTHHLSLLIVGLNRLILAKIYFKWEISNINKFNLLN